MTIKYDIPSMILNFENKYISLIEKRKNLVKKIPETDNDEIISNVKKHTDTFSNNTETMNNIEENIEVVNSDVESKKQKSFLSKLKLSTLQEKASINNIDIKKSGKKGLINKSKDELIKEILSI